MRGVVLAGFLAAACSSPHPITGDAAGTGDASVDGAPDAAPPPPCSPFTTEFPAVGFAGLAVWTGNEFLVLKQQRPAVIQRVASDGTLGPTIQLDEDVVPSGTSVAWSGDTIAVLATGATTRELVRYTLDGTRLGSAVVRPSNTGYDSMSVMWAGDRYVVAWMDMDAMTAHVREVSSNDVLGTEYLIHIGTPEAAGTMFNIVDSLTLNASTYAVELGTYGGPARAYVLIDRATGQISATAAPANYYLSHLRPRDDSSFAVQNRQDFRVLGISALSPPAAVMAADTITDMVRWGTGYRVWSNVVDAQTMTDAVSTLDIDLDGNTVTSAMPVTTFPSNQSYAEAGGVWRGDGFLTQVEYGPNPNMTVRLVQDCVP